MGTKDSRSAPIIFRTGLPELHQRGAQDPAPGTDLNPQAPDQAGLLHAEPQPFTAPPIISIPDKATSSSSKIPVEKQTRKKEHLGVVPGLFTQLNVLKQMTTISLGRPQEGQD